MPKRRRNSRQPPPVYKGKELPFDNDELRKNGWEIREKEIDGRVRVFWYSPGPEPNRKLFKSAVEVDVYLKSQEKADSNSDSDYLPSSQDSLSTTGTLSQKSSCPTVRPVEVPDVIFVGNAQQTVNFVEEINGKFQCKLCGDKGQLVPVWHKTKGLGGAMEMTFQCVGCAATIHYASSSVCLTESRRNAVSLALALAFFIWGKGYASYYNVLRKGLGVQCLSDKSFTRVIELAYPQIKHILDEACDDAKAEMMEKEEQELGSWKRAVTTSDGCWLIRGFHSQCATFVVVNYLTNALLYYGHLCMRGANAICDADLWEGTSKAAEGHLAFLLFCKARDEGMVIAINWQDADSTSQLSFREIFPDGDLSRVMLCGGHVGRAHGNNLKEFKIKKTLDTGYVDKHKKNYPAVESVKCHCKKHAKKCGCFTDDFLSSAKRNHFCVLKQCKNDPSEYAERMMKLGKYHSKDIHEWVNNDGENEYCDFHPLVVCSCGNCKAKEESVERDSESDGDDDGEEQLDFKCAGKKFQTRTALTCPMHALVYEIECKRVGDKASQVIDKEMGRGHSNLPESRFSVLAKFRGKDTNLHQLHYEAITNIGLLQGNMTYFTKTNGAEYHWALELYVAMGLPIPDGLGEQLKDDNIDRMRRVGKAQEAGMKAKRAHRKRSRAEEQNRRKKYNSRQRIVHNYGEKDDDVNEEDRRELAEAFVNGGLSAPVITEVAPPLDIPLQVEIGGIAPKPCRCGSTEHRRASHKDCPLNSKKK